MNALRATKEGRPLGLPSIFFPLTLPHTLWDNWQITFEVINQVRICDPGKLDPQRGGSGVVHVSRSDLHMPLVATAGGQGCGDGYQQSGLQAFTAAQVERTGFGLCCLG